MSSTLIQRSVLQAQVNVMDEVRLQVYCTHLASDLSNSIQYNGTEFDSFAAEQKAQINEFLTHITDQKHENPVAILGDLNTGPANDINQAELPENFELFQAQGYRSPYIQADSLCTHCSDNTIIDGDGSGGDMIDHVLFKGIDIEQLIAKRTFDQTQAVTIDDMSQKLHLSDHFGIQVAVPLAFLAR